MVSNPSLGNLSHLPPEIRLEIWDHLSLDPSHSAEEANPKSPRSRRSSLAFLRTSHQIHDEISQHLYKDVVLRFQVPSTYDYRSWLTVESSTGTRWHIRDKDDAVSRGFAELPYEELKGVQIRIDAPNRSDPGQVVNLWKKCLDLAGLLGQAGRGLPNMEIHFFDRTEVKWSVDGKPQKSIAVDRPKNHRLYDSRLRNARTAKIYLPEDMWCDDYLAINTEDVLVEKPSGPEKDATDPWSSINLQIDQDKISMNLDIELDVLPGSTARMMRLERFSSWFTDGLDSESKYERELERILRTWRRAHGTDWNTPDHIRLRYAAMLAYNPRSLFHPDKPSKGSESTARLFAASGASTLREAFHLGVIKEEWDRDSWHNGCYPTGIPRFDSEEFFLRLMGGLDGDVTKTCEEEFNKRLVKWMGHDERHSSHYYLRHYHHKLY